MDAIAEAIDKAYLAEITNIYSKLSIAISSAKQQTEIDEAKARFTAGINHAIKVRSIARELVGLPA